MAFELTQIITFLHYHLISFNLHEILICNVCYYIITSGNMQIYCNGKLLDILFAIHLKHVCNQNCFLFRFYGFLFKLKCVMCIIACCQLSQQDFLLLPAGKNKKWCFFRCFLPLHLIPAVEHSLLHHSLHAKFHVLMYVGLKLV